MANKKELRKQVVAENIEILRVKIKDKRKRNMLISLQTQMGVVSAACRQAKIVRKTHYNWLHHDPEYKRAVEQLPEISIDYAESSLFKLIGNGNVAATIFYLKTKGKKRGYIETTAYMGITAQVPTPIIVQRAPTEPEAENEQALPVNK